VKRRDRQALGVLPEPPVPGRFSRSAMWAITLLLPLGILVLLEVAMRLAGAGRLEPLFVPVEGAPGYEQPNPQVIKRFFPNPEGAPTVSIDTTYFSKDKPERTYRVFVLGESSAAGFPYGRWASPGEFLARRLQRGAADRDVEVVTTAMAAVTSYVLLDFVEEILAREPDAVVIYTGHNEYLGIGGVGSSYVGASSPALARLTLSLRRLHLYRGFETRLSQWLGDGDAAPVEEGTLMSRVARERQIQYGSVLYERGLEQFRGNMQRILERFAAAGVPVFVGTLASNERDQPPFLSVLAEGTDADAWEAASSRGRAALEAGDATAAETAFREALARDEGGADAWHGLGGALLAQGRRSEAREAFLAAKDRDALRFRAPEAMNDILRELTGTTGTTLVDTQHALAQASEHRIIGADLMLEHLHPNVRGYFLLGDAFYEPLAAAVGSDVRINRETAWLERPTTELDALAGGYRVAVLRNDWPFVPERRVTQLPAPQNDIERLAQAWFTGRQSWAETMTQALSVYQQQGNALEAARVAVNLAEAFVTSAEAQGGAGRLLLRIDSPAMARRYLGRAVEPEPDSMPWGLTYAEAQFKSGDAAGSAATLERLIALAPEDARPKRWLEVVKAAAGAAPVQTPVE
jgi:tetratricopeptide (TPR) repeat protein